MNEYIINCPCCENKIRIQVDGSGKSTAFLFDGNSISQEKLANSFGIELGIVEIEKEVN